MQEGTLTWSLRRNSLPLPARRAHMNTSVSGAFGRFIFHHFSWCVFVLLFHVFWMDLDLHFGGMLASFSMFFAWLFRASILHWFFINFARISICFLKYFCWFPWSYIQLAKASKTRVFTLLLHSLHFRKHMFFHYFLGMFRCSLFAQFGAIFCNNVGVVLVWIWHKNWRFFDVDFLIISWCVFRRLLAPKMIRLASLWRPKVHQKSYFSQPCFLDLPGGSPAVVWSVPGLIWCHFGTVVASCCYRFLMFFNIFWSIGVRGGGGWSTVS